MQNAIKNPCKNVPTSRFLARRYSLSETKLDPTEECGKSSVGFIEYVDGPKPVCISCLEEIRSWEGDTDCKSYSGGWI